MMVSLAKMTDDELIAESQRLNAERETHNETYRQKMLEVKYEQDRRAAVEALREPLSAIPEDQRQSVIDAALQAGTVTTEEDEDNG